MWPPLLAAYAPDLVSGVVLEDQPLSTTHLPRATKSRNYVDLATTAHSILHSGETDFVAYNATRGRFFAFFGELRPTLTRDILAARTLHPADPVMLASMPPVMNELFRGLNRYDPRFGVAFYTDSWDVGFDETEALARFPAPAVLIHTNWSYDAEGILMAAMDDRDAERARSLLNDVEFFKVVSSHGFHFEKPRNSIRILIDFAQRIER